MGTTNSISSTIFKVCLGILLSLVAIALLQNWKSLILPFPLKFLGSETTSLPTGLWLFLMVVTGWALGYIYSLKGKTAQNKILKEKNAEIEYLKKQLDTQNPLRG